MGFSYDRTDDGLLILREILIEPDIPTILWYLENTDEAAAMSNIRPGPLFARARRRRKRPVPSPVTDTLPLREDGAVPSEVISRLQEISREARGYFTPVAFLRIDPVTETSDDHVRLADVELRSRRLRQLLDGCSEAAVFLCSLGHGIEDPIHARARRDDADARALEAVASAALLDLTQALQRRVEAIARAESLRVTHCQWPGFCDWPEEQALHLMKRVGGTSATPVSWQQNGFRPAWSFLGLVGMGPSVSRIRNNPCRICDTRRGCARRIW